MLMIGLMAIVFSSCQSESGKKQDVIIPTPAGVPSASTQTVPSGQRPTKNPEHGQPFHDCAIPVGADLVAENLPAQPKAVEAPVNMQPEVQQQAVPTANDVKLNPAHGAPGHRCDIAVGAPLS
ncbi:hypothetical protein D3C86_1606250 [compost metagenome]